MEWDVIYNQDCLKGLRELPSNSVDLVVTSPPYDNLRAYGGISPWDLSIFEQTATQLFRVIKYGGVVVWVVGDATVKGSETGTSFKQALFFKEIGFNLHDTMIYAKYNPIPQNHDRYEQCFEYMFVFSKGKPKTFNPLTEETKNGGKSYDWGNRVTLMDKKQCRHPRGGTEIRVTKGYKNRKNIFYYSVGGGSTGHPAVFPEQLAIDHILSWSNEGDIVLDPFLGSGTTAIAAMKTGRKYIGYEINPKYFDICCERISSIELQML